MRRWLVIGVVLALASCSVVQRPARRSQEPRADEDAGPKSEKPVHYLCLGDSNMVVGSHKDGSWCGPRLSKARPDLTFENHGVSGADTIDGLALLRKLIDAHRNRWDAVIIQLGVNDPSARHGQRDPAVTVGNLVAMADLATSRGMEVYLLVPFPVVPLNAAKRERADFTAGVSDMLLTRPETPRFTVINVRSPILLDPSWQALSTDGVHLNAAGRARMVEVMAEILP